MQERNMMLIKEKLEKKFYRTKSETHRLNEINHEMSILKNGKNHLLNEFRDKINQYKNHPYDDNGYQDILNSLKAGRQELIEEKQAYKKNLTILKQDVDRKRDDICEQDDKKQIKKEQLADANRKLAIELFDNDQLNYKFEQLTYDIKIVQKGLQNYVEIEGLQEQLLDRLQQHKHIGDIKKVN